VHPEKLHTKKTFLYFSCTSKIPPQIPGLPEPLGHEVNWIAQYEGVARFIAVVPVAFTLRAALRALLLVEADQRAQPKVVFVRVDGVLLVLPGGVQGLWYDLGEFEKKPAEILAKVVGGQILVNFRKLTKICTTIFNHTKLYQRSKMTSGTKY